MTFFPHRHPAVVLLTLTVLACLAALASLTFGARVVSAGDVLAGLRTVVTPLPDAPQSQVHALGVMAVAERVPRTVTALLAGAALGTSGAVMQALTRNPIADPGILGINTGASFAMVLAIAFGGITALPHYLWTALLGATLTAVVVYLIGSAGPSGATPLSLALAGVATTAALSSLISAVMLPRAAGLTDFRFWQVGSLGRGTWQALGTVAPLLVLGWLMTLVVARPLNSLALGDDVAVGLGVQVGRTRLLAAAAGVLLAATTTALAGPIGFVGLMVPHAVRLVIGVDHRWLLPGSAVGGAVLLTLADIVGRVIARPAEVSVGVVTAFVGAPVLIALARGARVRTL